MHIYLHHTYSHKETHLCVQGILRVSGHLHSSGDGCHIPCRMARQELQPVSPKAPQTKFKAVPVVSIVVPVVGVTNYIYIYIYISRILGGIPKKELQWRL